MKVFTLVTSLAAAAYAAESSMAVESAEANAAAWQAYEALVDDMPQGQKKIPSLASSSPLDGAQRVTSKLGPYAIQSARMTKVNKAVSYRCPYAGCLVTAMEATIKYRDGSVANTDTGAWMHHIAMFGSLGSGGAKGLGVGGGGSGGIWAAGNERPTLRLNDKSTKYGLDFTSYFIIIDLMSEEAKSKNVTLEITYEVVPKNKAGYKAAQMLWLTIGEPAAKQGKYSFNSMPQSVKSAGTLLYAIGHMHDGGTDMVLKVGATEKCKSKMYYTGGKSEMAMEGGSAKASKGSKSSGGHSHKMRKVKRQHAHGAGGGEHISYPGACTMFGSVTAGTSLRAVANYDANAHPLMMHNGKPEKLMGNMRVYIGPK